ncbi:MAG TPA: hypothetical protein VIK92_05000 [Thermaerobacter sp.]
MRRCGQPLADARFFMAAACLPARRPWTRAVGRAWQGLRRAVPVLVTAALLLAATSLAAPGAPWDVRAGQAVWTMRTATATFLQRVPGPGQEWLAGEGVRVRYPAGHRRGAEWVLAYAERVLPRVAAIMGTELPAVPAVFIVYESPADLARTFGWDPADPPLGFYAGGAIHVADPLTWAADRATFERDGPVPHELAHWLLDRVTYGNYPAWFTEGLAQAVDRELTGFTFGWSDPCPQVDWETLNNAFHTLPTGTAYGAALCLYDGLAARGGTGALGRLVERLAAGQPFAQAVREVYGVDARSLATPPPAQAGGSPHAAGPRPPATGP